MRLGTYQDVPAQYSDFPLSTANYYELHRLAATEDGVLCGDCGERTRNIRHSNTRGWVCAPCKSLPSRLTLAIRGAEGG